MGENHFQARLPELDGAEYLVRLLNEAGLVSTHGMGPTPLSWQEIESWLRVTETKLCLWEKLMVRELSEVYLAEFNAAIEPDREDPYTAMDDKMDEEDIVVQRNEVQNKLYSAFMAIKAHRRQST